MHCLVDSAVFEPGRPVLQITPPPRTAARRSSASGRRKEPLAPGGGAQLKEPAVGVERIRVFQLTESAGGELTE